MISLTLTLSANEKPSYHWGSAFHGMLMALLPAETAGYLHGEGQHLLSQWVEPDKSNQLIWHISLLGDELAATVMVAISGAPALYSRDRHTDFPIIRANCSQLAPEELFASAIEGPAPKRLEIEICTPATHRSAGRYVTLPTAEMIARSLARRMTNVWPGADYTSEELMQELLPGLHVGKYSLHSATYGVGGSYAIGYTGRIEFRFEGDDQERRLLCALFSFAPWLGIGAKTALGMGGCRILSGLL